MTTTETPAVPAVAPSAAEIAADMRNQLEIVAALSREMSYEYTSKPRLRDIGQALALSYSSMVYKLMGLAETEAAAAVVDPNQIALLP